MSYSINFLSASVSGGFPIQIGVTGSPGTIIHSGVAGTSQIDEVFLYANNTGNQFSPLVLEVGGTGFFNRIVMTIATQDSPQLILQGWPLNSGAVIRGFSPSGSGLFIIGGYVQRGP
jgi:hypothetical protein